MAELIYPKIKISECGESNTWGLVDKRQDLYYALRDAIDRLQSMAPKPEDYDDIAAATEQHLRRLATLEAIKEEISNECVVLSGTRP